MQAESSTEARHTQADVPARALSRALFRAPASIFWAALALRLACILIGHTYRIRPDDHHFEFGFEAGRIARSLVTGGGYGNPFNGYSGPTAWLPPLYPLLMALAFKLLGVYTRGSAVFLLTLDSMFSALIAPAVYEIAARCFDAQGIARRGSRQRAPVALWSAWLWALYPAALQYAVHWIWEMSLSACLFTWALVIALRLRGTGEADVAGRTYRLRLWSVLGLLWGAIALSNASLLLAFPASLVWILWPELRQPPVRSQVERLLAGPVLACVVSVAVLTPWIIRNEHVLHAFVPTRSNFGIELWHSSQFAENGPLPWGGAMPMSPHAPEFQHYVALGELRYAREKAELARHNLRARPDLFVEYTLERIQFFWFGVEHPEGGHRAAEFIRLLNYSFTSLAGLLGLGLMLWRRIPGAGLFAWSFLLLPLVYYAVTVQPRFRHPLEPLIAICAVYLFRSTISRRSLRAGIPKEGLRRS